MEEILIKIIQFFLAFTILVSIHEFGHFITAKIFGVRVEKFYIFFNPWFALLKFRFRDTEYGLGWVPLGGYCKMAGMVDESLDTEGLEKAPEPYEFRAKAAWKRAIVLVAGVTMNMILAFMIYCSMAYSAGKQYIDNQANEFGYDYSQEAQALGFRNGDQIKAINGEQIVSTNDILSPILLSTQDVEVNIVRQGESRILDIPQSKINALRQISEFNNFIELRMPFVIDSVINVRTQQAGLVKGDIIHSIDGTEEQNFFRYAQMMDLKKGQDVVLGIDRKGESLELTVTLDSLGKMGVIPCMLLPVKNESYTLLGSIPAGWDMTKRIIGNYLSQLKLISRPETKMYSKLGGFISIGKIFPSRWDWLTFWNMTAFLSIILAIMNLLPIPGLDGGHLLFTLYEMITGRKPSTSILVFAQYIGLFILLLLVLWANGSDIYRLFH